MIKLSPVIKCSTITTVQKNKNQRYRRLLHTFFSSVWVFPAVTILIFLILVSLRIHGSSIGIYHTTLFGNSSDTNLVYGNPREVRSDEWLTWTQQIVSQEQNNYPTYNDHRGSDNDVTKNAESPVRDWVNIFRIQNWSFLVMPLEYAFALKWWLPLLLLVLSCYFFMLRLLPGKRLLSSLLSIAFTLSPFLLWWYQAMLFLPMAFGFIAMIIGLRIINQERLPKIKSLVATNAIYAICLAYVVTSTALLFYPPYAIPVFLIVAAFIAGQFINKRIKEKTPYKKLALLCVPFVIGALLTGAVVATYAVQHHDLLEKTSDTVYPGARRSQSGGLPKFALFDGYLMPLLQNNVKADGYYTNQSEASNFILPLPLVLLLSISVQFIYFRKKRKVDWAFLIIQVVALLFIVRAVVPIDSILYKFLLLDWVPNTRLRSGMGFAGIVLLGYSIGHLASLSKVSRRHLLIGGGILGTTCLIVLLFFGIGIIEDYPSFIKNYLLLLFLAGAVAATLMLFAIRRPLLGAILFTAFSLVSSSQILPLYRGLDFLENGAIVKTIQEVSKPNDNWITVGDLYYLNMPLVAGRDQLDGTQEYPDFKLWEQVDGEKYDYVYNRQAKVVFVDDPSMQTKMGLVQQNFFKVKFECSSFVLNNAQYALSISKLNYPCVQLEKTITYPKKSFYIYKIIR